MPTADNNGTTITYDTIGDRSGDPLLLIMGFTMQLTAWHEDFCHMLADRGRYVVRFDNRDAGLSSKTEGPPPDMMAILLAATTGQEITAAVPYTLSDMAADAVAVLDDLGIDRADIVGASMGGMIAQHLAIEHPTRVRSLTSIMSTTGDRSVGQADPQVSMALLAPAPEDRDGAIERGVTLARMIAGPLFDEAETRQRAAEAYDRSNHPIGAAFQLAAIAKSGDRTAALGSVDLPTLVVHGRADTLIAPSGGEATAAAIDGAELLLLDEMGHDLPKPLWDQIVGAIIAVGDQV